MRPCANPEDFFGVLKNAKHRFVSEAALHREHVDTILRIKPADAVPGGEPNSAFGGDADRLCFNAGQALCYGPEAEIVGAVGIDAKQAAFGSEINFAPVIEGQRGGLTEKIVDLGEWQLMKPAPFQIRDASGSDNPDTA